MGELHFASIGVLPSIPDSLTIPQFQLDLATSTDRPARPSGTSCFIDDLSGKQVYLEEVRERTQGLANALSSLYSIGEDDVVLLFSRNHLDYPIAIWAAHRVGAIVSPANPDFTRQELEYQLKATKAKLLIAHPDVLNVAIPAAQAYGLAPDRILIFDALNNAVSKFVNVDSLVERGLRTSKAFLERRLKRGEGKTKLAFLSFSSGTTGTPKAVAIPHIAVIANVLQLAAHSRINEEYGDWNDRRYRPGDTAIGVLPFYHIYGLVVNLHFLLYCGMSIVIVPKFNFEGMLKSIVRHKITHLMIVPPQAVLLCKHPAVKKYDLSGIRYIMIGAAPLSDEVNERLFKLFPDAHIGQGYGMTETCTVISIWSIERKRGISGSAGQLIPGVVARILKSDGTLGGYGDVGELVVKAPSNALGYFNNPQATQETFVDGFVRTGDEVRVAPDGELRIIDRIKEIMKVRGFQVAPAELEGTLLCVLVSCNKAAGTHHLSRDHPDISDACVVGVPDDYSGEVPLAFVVLTADAAGRAERNPHDLKTIRVSILKHVADLKIGYKHLAGGVEFVDSIPKNPSGKLLRRVLRERAKELKTTKAKL
ncbi:phenylacetyl-CoA ligase [Mycena belliarum]|uniref:Phenylacetyl-CoA ligase n=1 Tax=Mycena belliarum TaxID=1033014 RepID=A0AAD6TR59_9AGAR|nr:phenylacetyl-CoA ligase [Mycena belliae]